ncbi:MAG TPA: hypothetical protein VFP50_15230 [Anaeromyxobacteraceae bacterium]|nr:hypothetical protein [Anaeromyxobacteraceae bacterium]
MSPMVTIRLRERDAEEIAAGEPAALQRAQQLVGAELARRRSSRAKRAARSVTMPRREVAELKPASGQWGTKALRAALWTRAEGRCECGCGRSLITFATAEMDHFWGRAKAPQTPETCWLLARECHRRKTDNIPSRTHWLNLFLWHLESHGFGRSDSARRARAVLEAEEQLEAAEQRRVREAERAVEQAEDLAERARRAEGASDA